MAIIKSYSVGNGDMFFIKDDAKNFTVIDCCLPEERKNEILNDISLHKKDTKIYRFISTHPDNDHILNIKELFSKFSTANFYCTKNSISNETDNFKFYATLRDANKTCCLNKSLNRQYFNIPDKNYGSSNLYVWWPLDGHEKFKEFLGEAKTDLSSNSICPIIEYRYNDKLSVLWFGDLESKYTDQIKEHIIKCAESSRKYILFAPHHGRKTGKPCKEILDKINPILVIVGEGDSEAISYYDEFKRITQNRAKDITLEIKDSKIFVTCSGNSGFENAGLKTKTSNGGTIEFWKY